TAGNAGYSGAGGKARTDTTGTSGLTDRGTSGTTGTTGLTDRGTSGTTGTTGLTDRNTSRETAGGRGADYDTSRSGTDDAMTRSEERLRVGSESQEVGKARLRKSVTTENVTRTVPVQHEEVRLEREPITDANRGEAHSGPDISEA